MSRDAPEDGLRVAQVIGGLQVGGAERNLVNTFNAMRCGYRAAIFTGPRVSGSASFHDQLDADIEQHFARVRQRTLPAGIGRLAVRMRALRLDVVHTHMYTASLYGVIAARLAGVPVVVTSEHGENPWKTGRQRWLERRVISPLADARFCVSPQILARRRDVDGVPAGKLHLMVNGTPLPELAVPERGDTTPVIGAVGRCIPAKDFPRLLEAVAEVRARGAGLKVVILGDGPEAPVLRRKVGDLGLEGVVELPGTLLDVDTWYRRFDVYVSSSIREGQPMALLEAMAYGLPIVSTDVGAVKATLGDGGSGLIVPPGDTTALANALERLVRDKDLRRVMGIAARRRVEAEYSVQRVADQLTGFYRDVFAAKRTGRLAARDRSARE